MTKRNVTPTPIRYDRIELRIGLREKRDYEQAATAMWMPLSEWIREACSAQVLRQRRQRRRERRLDRLMKGHNR